MSKSEKLQKFDEYKNQYNKSYEDQIKGYTENIDKFHDKIKDKSYIMGFPL